MLSSSVDLSALPAELASQVQSAIDRYEAVHVAKDSWGYTLDHGTDEEIMQKALSECGKHTPLVIAKDYPPSAAERYCQIREVVPYSYTGHPRRPIAMRGARLIRYWRHAYSPGSISPNGWAYEVFLRALRMTKKTLIDPEEVRAFVEGVASAVARKHSGLSYHYWQRCEPKQWWYERTGRLVLMNGRLKCIPHEQFAGVERLFNIIRKTDKLEERLKLARESRRY